MGMKRGQPVFAKRASEVPNCFQTLEGHTRDALRVIRQYLEERRAFLEGFCQRWNIPVHRFLSHLLVATALHDVGKATAHFQRNIRRGAKSSRYPHAFYALPITLWVEKHALPPLLPESAYLASSCILGHHTQLSSNMYSTITAPASYLEEPIDLHLRSVEKWCRREVLEALNGGKGRKLSFEWNYQSSSQLHEILERYRDSGTIRLLIRNLSNRTRSIVDSDPKETPRLKAVYSYMLALLRLGDTVASQAFEAFAEREGEPGQTYGPIYEARQSPVPSLPDLKLRDLIAPHTPYPYQAELEERPARYASLFAPCGRGKTQAALAWAHQICRQEHRSRIIIALPTQTTCNAMYDRLRKEHYGELVGLYHGMSLTKLRRDLMESEEQELENDEHHHEDLREPHFRSEIFLTPVTVTTVDHLLLSFVHGYRRADFALGNLQESVVIFDEVHNYEELTLSHIVRLFGILTAMGIPFLFMSATLPHSLVEKARAACPHLASTIVDQEGLTFRPYRVVLHEDPLIWDKKTLSPDQEEVLFNEPVIEEMARNHRRGLRQFIVLNTVSRARRLYLRLRQALGLKGETEELILYHSQFTYRDRLYKESIIQRKAKPGAPPTPFTLVATQVIEVSLDISADVMYTELAPVDALGQRGGRLHRKGRSWQEKGHTYLLHIHPPCELAAQKALRRPYKPNLVTASHNLLEPLAGKPASYKDWRDLCDTLYKGKPEDNWELERIFRLCTLFGRRPDRLDEDEEATAIQLRTDDYPKIRVIPQSVLDKEMREGHNPYRVENMVRIPLSYYDAAKDQPGEHRLFYTTEQAFGRRLKRYIICAIPYTRELGFNYDAAPKPQDEDPANYII